MMTAWVGVLRALTTGPDLPVQGTVRAVQPEGHTEQFLAARVIRVITGDDHRIWRHGARLRVEREDGTPVFVTDGSAWDFTRDPQRPLRGPVGQVQYLGNSQFLLRRRSAAVVQ